VRRPSLLALGAAALALAACGADDGPAAEQWPGPSQAGDDGRVPVEGFNELIETRDPAWARTPALAAAAFYGERDRPPGEAGELSIVEERPERDDQRAVVVTDDGLPDDSIRAVRWELRFERADDGTWRLVEARWSQRCQPDRGHQDFAPEPCV
jgi:hypothetical protein